MESGARDREPELPQWIARLGQDWEENADRVNALTFENNHEKPWTEVYKNWRNGFLRLLDLGNQISERELLDGDRYSWLRGYNLASILIASYDHHQEHFEKLREELPKHGR
jgi:hypothetical protein